MRTLLFEVPPLHVATFAAAAGIIALVSLVACVLPSHRAARISPMEALAEQ
jgi:ABC-type lipoprotein release transport system permease subunit